MDTEEDEGASPPAIPLIVQSFRFVPPLFSHLAIRLSSIGAMLPSSYLIAFPSGEENLSQEYPSSFDLFFLIPPPGRVN
jgi:hypothetical protein